MAGRKFENGIDLLNQPARNAASASADTDVPNWGQVKSIVNGLDFKASVRLASTTNISITSPGASIDSVTPGIGDRILLKNQSTGSQNLIYIYQGPTSSLTIAPDSANGELSSRATVMVEEGTINAGLQYTMNVTGSIVVGTTALTWVNSGGGTMYTADGTTLTLTGTQFALASAYQHKSYAASFGDGSATSYTITHNLGSTDVIVQTWLNANGEQVEYDIFHTDSNTITVQSAVAIATNAARIMVFK